jgi:hypothetical protein
MGGVIWLAVQGKTLDAVILGAGTIGPELALMGIAVRAICK